MPQPKSRRGVWPRAVQEWLSAEGSGGRAQPSAYAEANCRRQTRISAQSAPCTPALDMTYEDLSSWFKKFTMRSSNSSTNSQSSALPANLITSTTLTQTDPECGTRLGISEDEDALRAKADAIARSSTPSRSGSSGCNQRNSLPSQPSAAHSVSQKPERPLRREKRSFFGAKKERALSADPAKRLAKRHSALEPYYANSPSHYLLDVDFKEDHHVEPVSLSGSVSSFLDTNVLMQKLKHKYNPKKCAVVSSKSLLSFSRSVFDLRHEAESPNDNLITKKLRTKSKTSVNAETTRKSLVLDANARFVGDGNGSLLELSAKPISASLLDAITNQLKDERIDLTLEPYSDLSGFCGIPPGLVQRYSEETERDMYEVADALDHIRLTALLLKGRRGVPNDFLADYCVGLACEQASLDSLPNWLISLGLPMYESALRNNGWDDLREVANMRETDFIVCGIHCKRHVRLLATAVGALHMNLHKIGRSS